jgi:YD repeat-containing protein
MKGALKRMMAGMQVFVTEAKGQGQIAFSRDGAGHIAAIHMPQGQELHVREHQFLAATHNIDYSFATGFFGSMNFITNRFTGPGRLGLQSMYMHMGTAE